MVSETSKWAEIRCDFCDEDEDMWYVDAWLTDDPNEEGKVIAKIDLGSKKVEYIDKDARRDPYAKEVIREMLEEGYLLTE